MRRHTTNVLFAVSGNYFLNSLELKKVRILLKKNNVDSSKKNNIDSFLSFEAFIYSKLELNKLRHANPENKYSYGHTLEA